MTIELCKWECVTDVTDYMRGTVTFIQQVKDSSVFRFVEVSPLYGGEQIVFYTGLVDVDAVNMKPLAEYYGGLNFTVENLYTRMMEYIMDYYGGERFDKQPFYYDSSSEFEMALLQFAIQKKGIVLEG